MMKYTGKKEIKAGELHAAPRAVSLPVAHKGYFACE